ncbi:hypothetical protein ACS0PU_010098 [Formica fusca]
MTDETKLFAPASREDVDMEKHDCFHLFIARKCRALVIVFYDSPIIRLDYYSLARPLAPCICACNARFFYPFLLSAITRITLICDLTYDVAYCSSLCTYMRATTRIFSPQHIDSSQVQSASGVTLFIP